MRFTLYFAAILFFASVCPAKSDDVTINTDLAELLDSFDGKKRQNPRDVPQLADILEPRGTLVFFDNTGSSGKKPKLTGSSSGSSNSGAMQRLLDKARKRLDNRTKNAQQAGKSIAEKAVMRQQAALTARQQQPQTVTREDALKYLTVNYDGEKAAALIPPDTVVEVPFLKHIPYFFSRIEILENGSVRVSETIERVVEKNETDFYGIDRHFSKYHMDRTGKKHRTNVTVLESSIDRKPVQTRILPTKDGIRISLHADKPAEAGTHLYQITYLFGNKIAEFKNSAEDAQAKDFKELIWDVTGRHWDVPITRAGAVMIFPPNSTLYSQTAATGGVNGFGNDFKIRRDKNNDLSFTLTFPLAPYEGLSVLANWSENNSAEFFENGKLDRFITDHGTAFVAFIACLFVLSYYIATLFSLRKNQTGQQGIKAAPLQKGDLTPAVLNYAMTKKLGAKPLFVSLLSMASKNFLAFDEQSDGTVLLIKLTDKETALTALEKKIAAGLFPKDTTSFAMTNANMLRLKRLMVEVDKNLQKEYRKKFTVFPHTYFLFGILMAVIALASVASMSLFPKYTALTAFGAVVSLLPVAFFAYRIYAKVRDHGFKAAKSSVIKNALCLVPFAVVSAGVFVCFAILTTTMTAVFFYALTGCILYFKEKLRAPSLTGNSILENMEGYKLYLSSQDETLLNVMRNAEQKIKSLYSKHLPFAVAMGLEQPWTHRFVAFSSQENQLKPDWYKGKLPFTDTFVEALYAAFSAAFPKGNTPQKPNRSSRFKKQ